LDKMLSDKTEMLYWLQEERKVKAISIKSRTHLLPPISYKHSAT